MFLFLTIASPVSAADKPLVNIFSIERFSKVQNVKVKENNTESKTFELVKQHLANFDFAYKTSSFDHALNYMDNYPNTCIRNIIKSPEREKRLIYSQPQTLYLGARLYLSPNATQSINEDTSDIDLVQFFKKHPEFVLGIEGQRSFGGEIDREVKLIPDKNKYLIEGSSKGTVLIAMLFSSKIDAIIQYPTSIHHAGESLSAEPVSSYGINVGKPYIISYLVCGKTEQGQQIINEYNKALSKAYNYPSYFDAHIGWVQPSNIALFKRLFNQVFINTSY